MSITDTLHGAEALLAGFGKTPQSKEVAQARADVCLHSGKDKEGNPAKCPHNHLGGWSITTEASRILQAQREKKHQLNLRVDGEEGLGVCRICKCFLPLKVFYDWESIYSHTTDEMFNQFKNQWPSCWMVKELNTTP